MPYKAEKLSEETITQIGSWINAGAIYDGILKLPVSANDAAFQIEGSDHWAFKIPSRPAIPQVRNRGWVRNPIDAFIAAKHEKRGLKPLPPAEKHILLRRVYLDLIGLPPTAGGVARLSSRSLTGRLREGGGPAAGQPALRRALGPPLDGRLALQRLVRLPRRQRGPRQPAAHLALARLDHRVAQRRTRATTA